MSAWTNTLPHARVWTPHGGVIVPPAGQRTGVVQLHKNTVGDDGGLYLCSGTSLFWAPWGYKFDRERMIQNAAWMAARGSLYHRLLGSTGPGHWEDRTIDPTWPDYREVIRGTTEVIRQTGARVQWTIFGSIVLTPTPEDRRRQVDHVLDALEHQRDAIQAIEIVNEPYNTGWTDLYDEIYDLADHVRSAGYSVVGLGADSYFHEHGRGAASVWMEHLDRSSSGEGGPWRYVRQPWECRGPWINNEGKGIDSSGEADDDPLRQIMFACVSWLANGPMHCVHHGAGIRGGGIEDLQRHPPRKANCWEQPTLEAILTGMAKMRALLPQDLPNWPVRCHSNPKYQGTFPWNTGPLDPLFDTHYMRIYAALNGPRFVALPLYLKHPIPLQALDTQSFTVYHPVTGEILDFVVLNGGETYTLDPDPAGVVIIGEFA